MKYKDYENYNLKPMTKIVNSRTQVIKGYSAILSEIRGQLSMHNNIVVCDFYPGVNEKEVLDEITKLNPSLIVNTNELLYSYDKLDDIFRDNLSDDRVFGFLSQKNMNNCFNPEKVKEAKTSIENHKGELIVVIGVGARFICNIGLFLYFDMARWEIQLRYRKGMGNWLAQNPNDPQLSKYKRGYFIEWRVADKHKLKNMDAIDYLIDTNITDSPKMIDGGSFRNALKEISNKPFRMQPYFDPGVWGGQWMKNTFELDPSKPNYAWSFDGVPEENSINIEFENDYIEVPTTNVVLYTPHQLLGEKVHGRFGREYPIRFDLLDTMEGQNLSLQVHPLTEYIQEKFGIPYTQDESYYILDAVDGSYVYLGLKESIDPEEMKHHLKNAEKGKESFPADKFVNKFFVKKHDHVLIPAGTVHCSGSNTMVLEISATPYIFTFKMWDWDRIGLDGLPRPIHLDHGFENIQWDRTTKWVEKNLINRTKTIKEDENSKIEWTGLHEREFIETIRYSTQSSISVKMNDSVQSVNVVEGKGAIISSLNNSFEPFEVHYAETFIIPASVGEYKIEPLEDYVSLISAQVR